MGDYFITFDFPCFALGILITVIPFIINILVIVKVISIINSMDMVMVIVGLDINFNIFGYFNYYKLAAIINCTLVNFITTNNRFINFITNTTIIIANRA